MTLEEAIIHAEEVAERCAVTDGNIKCESEHRQLAEWLKELKQLKEQTRWIPVSEKLPKPFTYVNITCRSLVDDRENWVVETLYLPIPKEVNKHGYSDWGNIPMLNLGDAEVIAWVERIIPQSYKVESEVQDADSD